MFHILKYLALQFLLSLIVITDLYSQIKVYPFKYQYLTKSEFRFSQIIDARLDKSNVGFVMNTAAKKIDTIKTDRPLELFLKALFDSSLVSKKKSHPFILKINALEFNKRQLEDEEAARVSVFCDFEVLYKYEDGTYTQIIEKKEALEASPYTTEKQSYDDSGFLSLLNWSFWDSMQKKIDALPLSSYIKTSEHQPLSKVTKDVSLFPIAQSNTLNSGIYTSIDEFLSNSPKIKSFKYENDILYKYDSTLSKFTKIIIKDNIYGFCDSRYSFINVNSTNQFVPVECLGTTFEIAVSGSMKVNNASLAASGAAVPLNIFNAVSFPSSFNAGMLALSVISLFANSSNGSGSLSVLNPSGLSENEKHNVPNEVWSGQYQNQRLFLLPTMNGILKKIPFVSLSEPTY